MGLQKPKTHRDINNPQTVGLTHLVRLEVEPDFCNSPTFSTLTLFPKVNHKRLTRNQEGLGDVIKIFLMRK